MQQECVKIKDAENIRCENCPERLIFHLREGDHEFAMGLTTVLECLAFAIEDGDLPRLPDGWCRLVASSYNINFSEDVSYHDGV